MLGCQACVSHGHRQIGVTKDTLQGQDVQFIENGGQIGMLPLEFVFRVQGFRGFFLAEMSCLTPAAEHDLEAIWTYTLQQWGVEQADRDTDILRRPLLNWRSRLKQPRHVTTCDRAIVAAVLNGT